MSKDFHRSHEGLAHLEVANLNHGPGTAFVVRPPGPPRHESRRSPSCLPQSECLESRKGTDQSKLHLKK